MSTIGNLIWKAKLADVEITDQVYVIAKDIIYPGKTKISKQFASVLKNEFQDLMNEVQLTPGKYFIYEYALSDIHDCPVRPFCDFDASGVQYSQEHIELIKTSLEKVIRNYFIDIFSLTMRELNKIDVIFASSHRYVDNFITKVSFHVTVVTDPQMAVSSNIHQKTYWADISKIFKKLNLVDDKNGIDESVYSNGRQMRLLYCSKFGDNSRYLRPDDEQEILSYSIFPFGEFFKLPHDELNLTKHASSTKTHVMKISQNKLVLPMLDDSQYKIESHLFRTRAKYIHDKGLANFKKRYPWMKLVGVARNLGNRGLIDLEHVINFCNWSEDQIKKNTEENMIALYDPDVRSHSLDYMLGWCQGGDYIEEIPICETEDYELPPIPPIITNYFKTRSIQPNLCYKNNLPNNCKIRNTHKH